MFRTVLVPLDGSRLAEEALPALREVASDSTDMWVLLLRIVSLPTAAAFVPAGGTPAVMPMVPALDGMIDGEKVVAARYLDGVRRRLLLEGFEHVETRVLVGPPQDRIVEIAEACSLVVMATSGRSGLTRAVKGSVTDHVVRNTPHSAVLVVRPVANEVPRLAG